jgi:hypothetical protein
LSDTKRYAGVGRHHRNRVAETGLGGLASHVTRQRLVSVIYYSDGVFQGYGFEN